MESYGIRAYQAIRENILQAQNWDIQEDETTENMNQSNSTMDSDIPTNTMPSEFNLAPEFHDQSFYSSAVEVESKPEPQSLSFIDSNTERAKSEVLEEPTKCHDEVGTELFVIQKPEADNDENLSKFFQDVNQLLSSELKKIKNHRISKQVIEILHNSVFTRFRISELQFGFQLVKKYFYKFSQLLLHGAKYPPILVNLPK